MKTNFPPRTKLEKWVRDFGGTKALAEELGVNQSAVQHWLGRRTTPTLRYTCAILKLAKGRLTLADLARDLL